MADVFVTQTLIYRTGDSHRVSVTITVGDGQAGESDGRLSGGGSVALSQDGDKQVITSSADGRLTGMILTCETRVKDINPDSDRTSVTHDLAGGINPESRTFPSIAEINGRVVYNISYVFV